MAKIIYGRTSVVDLKRCIDFAATAEQSDGMLVAELIVSAVSVLASHPFIGRSLKDTLRELVVSRGKTGFIVAYAYDEQRDEVIVLRIRHQREAGFAG